MSLFPAAWQADRFDVSSQEYHLEQLREKTVSATDGARETSTTAITVPPKNVHGVASATRRHR